MVGSAKMRQLRFNFQLDEIDDIAPWGEGDGQKLHWFGLTSGHYWISTPLGEALRYTDEQIRKWGDTSPYVDYQIARIFEDVQDMLPSVLEPVPSEIAALVTEDGWTDFVKQRLKSLDDTESRELWEQFWDATEWYDQRSLDTAYLVNGPKFYFCRIWDQIEFRWRASGQDAVQRWCLPQGQFTVAAEQFEFAAHSFFTAVLAETEERVARIATTGWQRTDCTLDVGLLVKEQRQRTDRINELKNRKPETDWVAVRQHVAEISAKLSIPNPVRQ